MKDARLSVPAGQPRGQAAVAKVDQGSTPDVIDTSAASGQPGQPIAPFTGAEGAPEQQQQLPNWEKAYPHHVRPSDGVLIERRFE